MSDLEGKTHPMLNNVLLHGSDLKLFKFFLTQKQLELVKGVPSHLQLFNCFCKLTPFRKMLGLVGLFAGVLLVF